MKQKKLYKKEFTKEMENKFIQAIEDGQSFKAAAAKIGVSRVTEWRHRKENKVYSKKVAQAKLIQIESVESVLYDLCVVSKNITAIIFYLKTNKPDKYLPEINKFNNPDLTIDFDFQVVSSV